MRHVLAAALLAVAAGSVSADVIQLTLSGSVTSSNMTAFPFGQNVTIVLTYESSGAPQLISNRQAFYVNNMRSFSMTSGGYSTAHTGSFGQINKYDNLSNFDGIAFQAARVPGYYQFTNPQPALVPFNSVVSNAVTQTLENIIINLASNSSGVWNNYDLPTAYNFAQFDQTVNMNFGWSGGSFSTGITTLLYENTSVPTPAGLGVLGAGLLMAKRRRRG